MKLIKLTKGLFCKVDDSDFVFLSQNRWFVATGGYAARGYRDSVGKYSVLFIHRLLVNAPRGMQVDHINGDRLDNQRHNLRVVTPRQNQWNTMAKKAGASGARGIRQTKNGKWAFRICGNGYLTKEDAIVDYNKGLAAIRGEYAILHPVGASMCEAVT